MVSTRKAAVFAAAILAMSVGFAAWADDALPEGLRGFSGQVRGVVTAKGDANVIGFKVGRILRIWKGNKAEEPELILGRTVTVGPRWVKKEGANTEWRPLELHVVFLRKLEVGQELTLEIRTGDGGGFVILELNKEQREMAKTSPEGEASSEKFEARIFGLEKQVERLEQQNVSLKATIRNFETRIKRLKAENEAMRQQMEEALKSRKPE